MARFSTVQAVVDRIAQAFTDAGIVAEVHLGTSKLPQRRQASLGQVVIVPTTALLREPSLGSQLPRTPFTVEQTLEVHLVAKAAKNVASPGRQYGDDLAQAEALRNLFLSVAQRFIPGSKRGGSQILTEVGENVHGVELVVTITVDLDATNITYSPVLAPDDTVFEPSCALVGPNETVECCVAETPTP